MQMFIFWGTLCHGWSGANVGSPYGANNTFYFSSLLYSMSNHMAKNRD